VVNEVEAISKEKEGKKRQNFWEANLSKLLLLLLEKKKRK
jgi:hypothetical protein